MPKVSSQVDRRSVVNPRQARALLEAVRAQQPSGPRLVAFFAVMYYGALRPEEAINLSRDNVILPPPQERPDDDDWGELHIRARRPTRAASGPTMAACARRGSSSTVLRETAASCLPIPN